jgi:hypothetical protein
MVDAVTERPAEVYQRQELGKAVDRVCEQIGSKEHPVNVSVSPQVLGVIFDNASLLFGSKLEGTSVWVGSGELVVNTTFNRIKEEWKKPVTASYSPVQRTPSRDVAKLVEVKSKDLSEGREKDVKLALENPDRIIASGLTALMRRRGLSEEIGLSVDSMKFEQYVAKLTVSKSKVPAHRQVGV